jgi:glycosyltransferase involved in cell wall biosynthesis
MLFGCVACLFSLAFVSLKVSQDEPPLRRQRFERISASLYNLMAVTSDALISGRLPRVSVVVPNFNGARYLPCTFASLISQTYVDTEVVVVDGASTDGSVQLIESWAERLPLRWISEPDSGQAEAINKGFRMATGEVMGWINSDDLLTPRSVELAAERFARDPDLDMVWGFCLVVDENERPLTIQNPYVREDLAQLRRHRNFVSQPGSWYSRRAVERFGPLREDLHYLFDYDFFLKMADVGRAEFIPEVMAWFRLHGGSKSGSQENRFLREEPRVYRENGGRWLSPFWVDYLRYRCWSRPVDRVKEPLRRIARRILGLPPGARIRS